MIPVVLSQLVAEAMMVWSRNIDLNVNSLPIAAAGAGVGVDYGIYHFSRMIDCYDEVGELDEAVDYATATTGKAIIFTATTMIAGTDLLVVLGAQVPGRDGPAAGPAHDLQHVRRARRRAGAG